MGTIDRKTEMFLSPNVLSFIALHISVSLCLHKLPSSGATALNRLEVGPLCFPLCEKMKAQKTCLIVVSPFLWNHTDEIK